MPAASRNARLRGRRVCPRATARRRARAAARSASARRAASARSSASSASLVQARAPPRRRAARARGRRRAGRSATALLERRCRRCAWCASSARCGSRLVAVERLERLDDLPVQPDAAGAREPVVERVADEDVREAQASGRAGDVGDDAGGDRLVEQRRAARPPRRRPGERARRARTRGRAPTRARARRLHSSERWVSRRAITSRTLCGIASRASAVGLGPTPSTASRRTISPTNSGLPSVSSCSAATSCGEAISGAVSSTYSRDLALAQPAERQRGGSPARARPRPAVSVSGRPGIGSTSR